MALCCIAFKGYAGGGTLPDAQGHDLKLSYSRTTLKNRCRRDHAAGGHRILL